MNPSLTEIPCLGPEEKFHTVDVPPLQTEGGRPDDEPDLGSLLVPPANTTQPISGNILS